MLGECAKGISKTFMWKRCFNVSSEALVGVRE